MNKLLIATIMFASALVTSANAGDKGTAAAVTAKIGATTAVRSAIGLGASTLGAAAAVTFTPSKIGCGKGETCR